MKPRYSIRRILPFPAIILAGVIAATSAQAATQTWSGASNNLSLSTNWVGSPTLASGDSFIFGTAGVGGLLLNNDLTSAFSIAAITYNTGAGAFVIGDGTANPNLGNSFTLTGNVTNNSLSLQTLNAPFTMTAVRTFTTAAGGGDMILSGNNSGAAGGITKAGGGTLTLSGTNSYTGATTVSGGLLNVTGTSTGSAFAVSGGALGGTGSIAGNVTVSSTGSINLANGTVGTLALGGTLPITGAAGANNLAFDLGSSTTDLITVVGATSVTNAGAAVINLNQIGGVATPITPGTYNLIQGTGAMAAVGQFAVATTKAFGSTYSLSVVGNNLQVTAAAGSAGPVAAFWKGGTNPWGTTANWTTDATSNLTASSIPGYQTNVTFATTIPGASNLTTNTVDADFEINSLNINATAGGVILGLASTKMITIDATAANGNTLGNGITSGNSNTIAAKIGLGSSQTWTISGGVLTASGMVTDFGAGFGLTKTGVGMLVLSGANAYNGPTTVSAGVLNIQNATALGTVLGGTSVSSGASLQIGGNITVGAEALTLNGMGITNDGALRSISGGTYGGLITLGSATRINTDAGVSFTINNAGTITGPGYALTFGGDGTTSVSSIIGTTSGTLTKDGAGTLVLSGNNTYTGATTVSIGTLKLGAAGTAPNGPLGTSAAGTTVAFGAVLDLGGFTLATAEALTLNGTGILGNGALTNSSTTAATYSGLVTLGSASSIAATSGDIILSNVGAITGSGYGLTLGGTTVGSRIDSSITTDAGTLTKIGSGTWSLTGTNTYSGGTTISAGALSFRNTGAKPASGSITVAAGATLGLGVATSGSFFTTADVDALFTNTLSGVTLSSTSLVGIDTSAGDFTYATTVPATTLGLNKLGNNKLTLTGANLYTGPTVVTAGTLSVSGSGTLGNSASFDITGTGTVDLGGTSQIVGPVNVTGAATLSNGSVTGTSYAASNPSGTATVSANLLVNGSAGLAKTGAGTLNLSGANTYTGTTTVNGGILQVSGTTGTIKASTAIAILNGGNLTLTNINATEAAVDRVSNTAGISVTNCGTFTFTNTAAASTTYAETIGSVDLASGQLNVVLTNNQNSTTNTQALTLSGLTRSGTTTALTVSAGTTAPNATTNMVKVTGASATSAGSIIAPWATVGTTAALQTDYAIYDGSTNIVPANIATSAETAWTSATGNYTLATSGTTTLTGSRSMNSWRYNNGTAGAIALAAFNFDTLGILNGNTGGLTISGTGSVRQQGTAAANMFINAGSAGITISAPIKDNTGALTLVKNGAGTLTLDGTNTYSGGTIVNAGSVTQSVTQNNNWAGTGNITIQSAGTLAFNRFNVLSTATLTLNGGTVTSGNSFASNIQGPLVLGATSTFNVTGGLSIAGNISGAGGLIKTGAGAIVLLSGTNTYSGPTTISAGGLQFPKPASLYNSTTAQWTPANITVASGALLALNVGGASDFSSAQVGTLLGNLATVNNNGLLAGSTVLFDTTNATATVTLSAALADSTGAGGGVVNLRVSALKTLVLSNTGNSYTGKTIVTPGTLSVASINSVATNVGLNTVHSASSCLGAPISVANGTIDLGFATLQGGATLIYTGTGETTDRVLNFAGNASSPVTLDQSGSGLLKFTSACTRTGSNALAVTLQGAGNGELVYGLPMVGALTKAGNGTWTLDGNNQHTGTTTISGGSLVIGSAGQFGSGSYGGAIAISSGANLTYNSSAAQTLAGVVSGAGTLIQAGPGILTLAGFCSYTGATTANGGTLLVNGTTAATSAVTINTGAALGGTGTIGGDVTLNSGAKAVFTLAAPYNTSKLTCAKALNLNNNVVHLNLPASLPDGFYTLAAYTTITGAFDATAVIDSGGLASGPGTPMVVAASNGNVTLSVGYPAITFLPNTLPNGTTIASYSQYIYAGGGAGAPFTNYTVNSGSLPPGLSLSSDGLISGTPNTLGNYPFTVQVQDKNGSPATTAQSYTISIVLPGAFTWKNPVSGNWSDATKWLNDVNVVAAPAAAGQANYALSFNQSGTYTPTQDLNSGFLLNSLNFGGAVTLAGTNGLVLTNNDVTLPQINQNSASTVIINPPVSLAANMTAVGTGGGEVDLAGVVSGTGSLTKTSTGTLKLYGLTPNTYSGGTIVNSGTLHLGSMTGVTSPLCTGTAGTGSVTLGSGATLEFDRINESNALILNGGTLSSTNGWGAVWSGPISGPGALVKTGAWPLTLSGTNTYTGLTTVTTGQLFLTKPAALYDAVETSWTSANISVASGASLVFSVGGASDFTTTQVATLLTNLSTVNNNGLKAGSTFGLDTTNATSTVIIGTSIADSTGSGGGALGILKLGTGTLELTGANSYTGTTTISGGTLAINNPVPHTLALITGGGNLVKAGTSTLTLNGVSGYTGATTISEGTLAINTTVAQTLAAIAGAGNLTKSGTSTLTLGTNTYTGDTTVSGGTLIVNGSSLSDAGKLVLNGGKVQATGTEIVGTLYFGTAQQAAGTWGATGSGASHIDDTHFSGITGVVSVAISGTPYSNWAAGYPSADLSNPAADLDGDGLSNFQEFAFGLNPTLASSVSPITSGLHANGQFSYTRRNPALTDLTYAVWTSLDLLTWTEDTLATQTPDSPTADVQTVSVTVTTVPTSGRLFVRVAAVAP
ncbi:MAG: autotransporter-associated beta strand repeat-containing protein [Verrucomicrobiota bacterium]